MGETGFVNVKNAHIYYEVAGNGKPIVFLHGAPLDSRMWQAQMDALSQEFQVIRFDMRGLGRTVDPGDPFTLYDDIHSLLQFLNIESAYFVGCSFGSYVGVEFALAHPEMVQRLILVCPGGFEPTSEDMQLRFKKIDEELIAGNIDEALEIYLHLFLDGPEQKKGRVHMNRDWLKEIYREIFGKESTPNKPKWLDPDPRGRLTEVQVPTLVVSGELDHVDFKRTAGMLVNKIPNAKRITFKNSAHFPNIDSPDEFNETVVSFLHPLVK